MTDRYVFTRHAFERMKEQNLSRKEAIELLKNGEHRNGRPDDRESGVFHVHNGGWMFVVKNTGYIPGKMSRYLVITATNQLVGPKAYRHMDSTKVYKTIDKEVEVM